MSFQRAPRFNTFRSTPAPPGNEKSRPIFGVGWRVLVTCPSGDVIVTDESGTSALATVADGVEVEILAWRPRRGGDTRYRVVSTNGGVEGWVGASSLKAAPIAPRGVPIAAPAATEPAPRPKSRPAKRSPARAR